jgi:integrase
MCSSLLPMPKPNNGPQLSLNDAGIYEIRWTEDSRSRRKSTGTSLRAEAEKVLGKFLLTRTEQLTPKVFSVNRILEDYYNEHVVDNVVCKERQEYCIDVLGKGFGDLTVDQLTPEIVQAYKRNRKAGKVNGNKAGDSTLRRELNCLIAAINHAVRYRRIKQTDVPHIELPVSAPPKDLWLDTDELNNLIASAYTFNSDRLSRIYRFVAIASETAARKNSILTLRWSQIDFESKLINFQNDGEQRTKKRRVAVPMSHFLESILLSAWAERTQNEWVLDNPNSIQSSFDMLKERTYAKTSNDVFNQITPHTLRHTWATLAARANVPMFEIAGVLGDTLTTVMRVYAHHCPDHLRGAVNFRLKPQPKTTIDFGNHGLAL